MSRATESVPLGPVVASPPGDGDFENEAGGGDASGKGKARLLPGGDEMYRSGGGGGNSRGPTNSQMKLMVGICVACLLAAIVSIALSAAALSQANSSSSSSSSTTSPSVGDGGVSTSTTSTTVSTTSATSTTTSTTTTTTTTTTATPSTTSTTSTTTSAAATTTTSFPLTDLQANVSAVQALAQSLAANSSGQAAQLSTLQNNVSTLKLQTETDVYTLQTEVLWLRQQLCSYNGLNFSTPVLQRLPTQGAIRWTSFRLGNTEHLAVANLRNDTSFNIQSVIYAFNLSSVSFVPWQYLNTSGASEMMHFRAGSPEEDFLLVTNAFNGTTENIFSDIYRYDRTAAQFVLFQQIDTSAARHAHAFVHANTTYLVVANYFNGTTHNILSNVYRYDNVGQQFVLHQQVPTSGASSVESVHINGVRYIAIANFNNDTSHTVPSNIYRFDNTTNQLVLHQQIITNGAFDWRAFSFNGTDFLAVANSFDGENHTIPSVVYRFDLATSLFLPFQNISTVAARSWEYFVVGSTSFLAVAEGRHVMNDTIKVTENSSIYYFDQTQQQFVHFRDIPTLGAVQWHHFTLGPSAFLALAEIRDDTSFSVSSPLYHLNRLCWNHLTPWREWAQESRALGINLEASFF